MRPAVDATLLVTAERSVSTKIGKTTNGTVVSRVVLLKESLQSVATGCLQINELVQRLGAAQPQLPHQIVAIRIPSHHSVITSERRRRHEASAAVSCS